MEAIPLQATLTCLARLGDGVDEADGHLRLGRRRERERHVAVCVQVLGVVVLQLAERALTMARDRPLSRGRGAGTERVRPHEPHRDVARMLALPQQRRQLLPETTRLLFALKPARQVEAPMAAQGASRGA